MGAGTRTYKSERPLPRDVQLECVFFGPFREDTGETATEWEPNGETVHDLLVELEAAYPVLEGRLLDDEEGSLAGKTVVTKNKRDVRHLDGLGTELEDGDVYRLVPSVYGG
ncbi:ubiquitin-like small modifier protein 1 [Natronosalvus caseinilyticus]|uniref:ubiquitin-like small modifier protein 1 n=1 Tax=Natronosalvus caseinilyticus TaxID=2953747 RepID=UPI0028A73C21|nr:ubiquitin-like small modifier protein 1 [Natronosalvus caseinilyticus]